MITVKLYGTNKVLDTINPGMENINAWLTANDMLCHRMLGFVMVVIPR